MKTLSALVLGVLLCAADFVFAQSPALPNLDVSPSGAGAVSQADVASHRAVLPKDYGVGNINILQIPAAAFVPFNTTWTHDDFGYFFPTTDNPIAHAWAPITLPSGSSILFIDLYYNDTDASNDAQAKILALTGSGAGATKTTVGNIASSTGSAGRDYASSNLFSYTVNNNVQFNGGSQLLAQVILPSHLVGFKAVDIWWVRQISPAPATATFGDVPTNHPFFRVIEALAASGITSGCGGGNFCPDGAVTRAEIAKFIVRALGLYWPDSNPDL